MLATWALSSGQGKALGPELTGRARRAHGWRRRLDRTRRISPSHSWWLWIRGYPSLIPPFHRPRPSGRCVRSLRVPCAPHPSFREGPCKGLHRRNVARNLLGKLMRPARAALGQAAGRVWPLLGPWWRSVRSPGPWAPRRTHAVAEVTSFPAH